MAEHGRPTADGGYRSNAGDVDYNLGYDSPGWDTQGFRRPETDFADSDESGQSREMERGGVGTAVRPDPGHAEESIQMNWETEATGSLLTPGLPGRGRRA